MSVALGLAFGSLAATVLGQWFPVANTPTGVLLLAAAACLVVLIWLWGGVVR